MEFPVQLNHDEITQLYDAISVAQTGRDIYGNFLPTIFESIHDFKPPFYTYATVIVYFLIGGSELTIKIPGIFFGILIIPAIFWFTFQLFKNRTISYFAAFITAISPFEIFFARKGFENGAGIFFMLIGFSALINYLEKKNKLAWLYLGIFSLAFGMYTYFSHALIIPLLIGSFIFIYRNKFKQISLKKYYLPVFTFSLLLVPLALIILLNPGSRYRSQTVFIGQDVNLGEKLSFVGKADNIFDFVLYYKTNLDFIFYRYLDQFNPEYLFLNGLDFTNQGPIGMGPLHLLQFPLILLGLIFIQRKIAYHQKLFIYSWIVIGVLPSSVTFEPHSPHRIIMVFTMLNIISAVGLYWLVELFKKFQKINFIAAGSTVLILSLLFVFNFLYFVHMYFVNLPFEKSQQIHYPFKQVAEFAWSEYNNFDQIIFDPLFGESAPVIGTAAHYYFAYYGNYPPAKFQREYRIGSKEREVLFGKFSIRKVDMRKDRELKNVLIIASPWSWPVNASDKGEVIKTFYYYDHQPAFNAIKL